MSTKQTGTVTRKKAKATAPMAFVDIPTDPCPTSGHPRYDTDPAVWTACVFGMYVVALWQVLPHATTATALMQWAVMLTFGAGAAAAFAVATAGRILGYAATIRYVTGTHACVASVIVFRKEDLPLACITVDAAKDLIENSIRNGGPPPLTAVLSGTFADSLRIKARAVLAVAAAKVAKKRVARLKRRVSTVKNQLAANVAAKAAPASSPGVGQPAIGQPSNRPGKSQGAAPGRAANTPAPQPATPPAPVIPACYSCGAVAGGRIRFSDQTDRTVERDICKAHYDKLRGRTDVVLLKRYKTKKLQTAP